MAPEREYKIESSARRCTTCDRVFAVGEEYHSAVVETEEEARLARRDFCPACWKPDAEGYYSFWKTSIPEPEPKQKSGPRLIDLGRLMQLFERLADAEEPENVRFRYVLALVLMRKRRLRLLSTRRLGGRSEAMTLREVGGDRQHTVTNPGLTDEEVQSVADRLREVLDMPERWHEEEPADAP
ncbi:MAG: hypothetical protein WBD63_08515 [Phycisphaerae bacterium]|nr:hypothetical protein [Phycisphaerae bacterium]